MNEKNKKGIRNGQSHRAATQLSLPLAEEKEEANIMSSETCKDDAMHQQDPPPVKDDAMHQQDPPSGRGDAMRRPDGLNQEIKTVSVSEINSKSKSTENKPNSAEGKTMQTQSTTISTNQSPPDSGKDFEEALADLEKIVVQLEGEVKLEEALQLFDKGMKLSKSCEGFLKTAEEKIEVLRRAADGSLSTEPFNEEVLV